MLHSYIHARTFAWTVFEKNITSRLSSMREEGHAGLSLIKASVTGTRFLPKLERVSIFMKLSNIKFHEN
jgi:hypothetical protein